MLRAEPIVYNLFMVEGGEKMSAENYSADGCVEDSVLEYNGARGLIFIGGVGLAFFLIIALVLVIFRDHVRMFNMVVCGGATLYGCIYFIYFIVHHYLEIDAKYIYNYNNGHLEISKARRNGPKKQLFSVEFDSLEVMGIPSGRLLVSDLYKKTQNNKYTEMEFVGSGLDGSRRESYAARFNVDGRFISIRFSPSEELFDAIKRQYPERIVCKEK